VRDDFTVLEQVTWLKERKKTYLELYPETKAGVAGGKQSGIARGINEDFFVYSIRQFHRFYST